ncbi:Fasciclin-1 [Eufriesea mexicana]|uniref:Fasciclin-1 n=1 Tax=Eufriesea mexicana TaxID=516756 RepID=A0A310SCH5_9HYME|nr:Fasciclin-1 [Eufriesea mexicana]
MLANGSGGERFLAREYKSIAQAALYECSRFVKIPAISTKPSTLSQHKHPTLLTFFTSETSRNPAPPTQPRYSQRNASVLQASWDVSSITPCICMRSPADRSLSAKRRSHSQISSRSRPVKGVRTPEVPDPTRTRGKNDHALTYPRKEGSGNWLESVVGFSGAEQKTPDEGKTSFAMDSRGMIPAEVEDFCWHWGRENEERKNAGYRGYVGRQRLEKPRDYEDILAANFPKTIENLGDSISSELEGNPPLWVTRRTGTHGQEVYINNAKILTERSNFQSKVIVGGDVKTQAAASVTRGQCLTWVVVCGSFHSSECEASESNLVNNAWLRKAKGSADEIDGDTVTVRVAPK